jgi:hypothetical protein
MTEHKHSEFISSHGITGGYRDIQRSVMKNPKVNSSLNLTKITELLKEHKLATSQLIFYDFESMKSPVPIFDHTRPYQQVCFQYSIHYTKDIDDLMLMTFDKAKNINHISTKKDSYEDFINSFIKDAYDQYVKEPNGDHKFVVYHKTFEMTRIKEMIKHLELVKSKDLEAKVDKLKYINDNTIDIKDYFNKFYF